MINFKYSGASMSYFRIIGIATTILFLCLGSNHISAETLAELNHIVSAKICPANTAQISVPDPHTECPNNYNNPCPASTSDVCFAKERQCLKQFDQKLKTVLRYNAHMRRCDEIFKRKNRELSNHRHTPIDTNQTSRSDELTFNITSNDPYAVQVSFYSQTRPGAEWPGGGNAHNITDSVQHSWTIACQPGEKICYGAWRRGRPSIYWGSGVDDSKGCSNCCATCGSGTKTVRLIDSGNGDDGGSSSPDFSGYIASGMNTIHRSQGSNPVHTSRPTPAPVQRSGGSRGTCPPVCTAQ